MQERASLIATATEQALILVERENLSLLHSSRNALTALGYTEVELGAMSLTDIVVHPGPAELKRLLGPSDDDGPLEVPVAALVRDQRGRTIAVELLLINLRLADRPLLAMVLRFSGARAQSGDSPRLDAEDTTFVDFAARLGHDMNNLLSTIIGSLGLIREEAHGDSGDDRDQIVDDALSASRECADLLDRLMAAVGKQLLHPQRVAVNNVVEQLTPLLRKTLPDNFDLRVSLAPELPQVLVDPDRLEAAIIALVVNAKEAMASGGELTISSGVADASAPHDVQITVSDGGPGIPENLLGRVLEPLFSTKASGTGRGLGLSIVNGFVQQSRGTVIIDSAPGRGTRVTLSFPPAD